MTDEFEFHKWEQVKIKCGFHKGIFGRIYKTKLNWKFKRVYEVTGGGIGAHETHWFYPSELEKVL